MANCPHTTFTRGKKVIIILKNGIKLVDRYFDKNNTSVEFYNNRIKIKDIRSISIFKN